MLTWFVVVFINKVKRLTVYIHNILSLGKTQHGIFQKVSNNTLIKVIEFVNWIRKKHRCRCELAPLRNVIYKSYKLHAIKQRVYRKSHDTCAEHNFAARVW